MICSKCGKEIDPNSKFCIYCGEPVQKEQPKQEESISTDETVEKEVVTEEKVEENRSIPSIEPILPEKDDISKVVSDIPTYPLPTQPEKKKKSKAWIFICLGVLLVAAVVALLCIFVFNKPSKNSVKSLETAMNNLTEKSTDSATVGFKVSLEMNNSAASIPMNITGDIKYQKLQNGYNFSAYANVLFQSFEAYASIDAEKLKVYINSSVLNMFGVSNYDNTWLLYEADLDEMGISLNEIENGKSKIVLEGKGIDEKIKYVGKEDGLKHYTLTFDKELIKMIMKEAEKNSDTKELVEQYDEQLSDYNESFTINLYVDKNDVLSKISINLIDMLPKESKQYMSKFDIEMEFTGLGTTVVTIPSNVIDSSVDAEEYFNSLQLGDDDLEDEDIDIDFDLDDTDTDIDFDFDFDF